jgi:hypothetical protein
MFRVMLVFLFFGSAAGFLDGVENKELAQIAGASIAVVVSGWMIIRRIWWPRQ